MKKLYFMIRISTWWTWWLGSGVGPGLCCAYRHRAEGCSLEDLQPLISLPAPRNKSWLAQLQDNPALLPRQGWQAAALVPSPARKVKKLLCWLIAARVCFDRDQFFCFFSVFLLRFFFFIYLFFLHPTPRGKAAKTLVWVPLPPYKHTADACVHLDIMFMYTSKKKYR